MTEPIEISHDLGVPVEGIGGPGEVRYETLTLPIDSLPELTEFQVADMATMRISIRVKRIERFEVEGKKKGNITFEILDGEITEPNLADRTHRQVMGNVEEPSLDDIFERQ